MAIAALIVASASAVISLFAAAGTLWSATNVASNDRRENEALLGEAVRAQAKLDARPVERTIRRFVSTHRDELSAIAKAAPDDGSARRLAKRLGDDLVAEIERQNVNAVVQCREVLSLMNRAGRASDGSALGAARPQLRQAMEAFANQGMLACLVSTESKTTRTGWFLARYFFGAPEENPLDVLHFSEDYDGLATAAHRVGVDLPTRYSPPTPSGDLKLTGASMSGCNGVISQVAASGSGNLVSGRVTYRIGPSWRPIDAEGTKMPCLNFLSADGLDQLQMGASTDGSVFAFIRTRFAEPFVVEIPKGQVDWSVGALLYELTWDFQRIDLDEAVKLTVNGVSAFGSPEGPPPAL
ncbi:MAG: hypothetical protein INH41_15475 [Myxococcaceae bacterium]|nr:hypothetical protein [Myxococcaceae bacterium]MCA3013779.1 hypothetical protein [Myxococcaceae bacterium]